MIENENPALSRRLDEPTSQVFKERPASIEEAGNTSHKYAGRTREGFHLSFSAGLGGGSESGLKKVFASIGHVQRRLRSAEVEGFASYAEEPIRAINGFACQ
ncbi:MAG: hypothetical protein ACLP3K_12440 [Candidatus Acidiferrales bacterium]